MATYDEIYGKRVEVFDSDPTLTSAYEGQVWYNSASGTLKTVVSFSAWSSQTNTINNLGGGGNMGFGTSSTSALFTGGGPAPSPTDGSQKTEEWNGVGFEAKADITQTQNQMNDGNMGFGTTTSGLVSGSAPGSGAINNWSQDWNGTSWEAAPTMPTTGRGTAAGYGVLTAGLNIGGYGNPIPPGRLNRAEEYTGSAWTAGGTLSTARYNIGGGAGTQTSAAACGGEGPSAKESVVENYDGSSFTAGVALPQAIRGGRTAGTSDSAYIFWGGFNPSGVVGETLEFDGTSFTDLGADMGTAGGSSVCAGTTTAAINIMSGPSPGQNKTQEFNKSINTITAAAWASGGNLNTARARAGGMLGSDSTQNASMAFGGQAGTAVQNKNEEYDGTSWTESGDLGTARRWHYGAGSQTAALCAGGVTSAAATPVTSNTEEYDGSSWSEVTNMGTGRYNGGSGGTQTAAFVTGGSPAPSYTNATEEYDGTNWTAGGNMLVSKGYYGGGGTLTAGIVMGMGPASNSSYEYDGSNWTAGGTMNRGCSQGTYAGLQTNGISFGGTPPTTATEGYDGTAWSTRPSMGTARYALAGSSGTSTSALGCGGEVTPQTNATEEFTGVTETVTAKTLTTS